VSAKRVVFRDDAYEKLVTFEAAREGRPLTDREKQGIEEERRRRLGLDVVSVCGHCKNTPPAGFTCQACGAAKPSAEGGN
jgi:hypothetical protein